MPGQVFHKRNVFHKGFSTHAPALFQKKAVSPFFSQSVPIPKRPLFPPPGRENSPFPQLPHPLLLLLF